MTQKGWASTIRKKKRRQFQQTRSKRVSSHSAQTQVPYCSSGCNCCQMQSSRHAIVFLVAEVYVVFGWQKFGQISSTVFRVLQSWIWLYLFGIGAVSGVLDIWIAGPISLCHDGTWLETGKIYSYMSSPGKPVLPQTALALVSHSSPYFTQKASLESAWSVCAIPDTLSMSWVLQISYSVSGSLP